MRAVRDGGADETNPRNGQPAREVELRLVVKAGSVLEDDDQRGLAHVRNDRDAVQVSTLRPARNQGSVRAG